MSDDLEKEIALYEAERNRAWHSWFAARGDVSPSDEHTRIFDGGFRMAWELCRAQPAPQPAEQQPCPTDAQILAITIAYEQGVGKGHDAHHRGEEIQNPYGTSWGCDKAWQMGYEEGKEQAANGAKSSAVKPRPAPDVAGLVEALELMVTTHDEGGWPTATITIARAALAAHRKGGES